MAQDISVCRFCLESNNTRRNPLIDPCECKGSLQFVHERCLLKWRRINPNRNAISCLICLTPYHLKELPVLEQIPEQYRVSLFFLRFPFLPCFTANYVLVFHMSLDRNKSFFDLFEPYQYAFQIFYLFLFFLEWKVQNTRLYWRHWNNRSCLYLCFLYLAANVLLYQGLYIMIAPINVFLGMFWQRHLQILQRLNEL